MKWEEKKSKVFSPRQMRGRASEFYPLGDIPLEIPFQIFPKPGYTFTEIRVLLCLERQPFVLHILEGSLSSGEVQTNILQLVTGQHIWNSCLIRFQKLFAFSNTITALHFVLKNLLSGVSRWPCKTVQAIDPLCSVQRQDLHI